MIVDFYTGQAEFRGTIGCIIELLISSRGHCQSHHFRLNKRRKFLIDSQCHPQTIGVVQTRAQGLGIETEIIDWQHADFSKGDVSGVLVQYPDTNGRVYELQNLAQQAHDNKVRDLYLLSHSCTECAFWFLLTAQRHLTPLLPVVSVPV